MIGNTVVCKALCFKKGRVEQSDGAPVACWPIVSPTHPTHIHSFLCG